MTVRLRSDRHPLFGPGFALLVFDRPIDAPRLDISILNIVTGLYLGSSLPGRPNWIRQRTTFFPAIRAGGEESSIFRVGPEVTTYIQEGTYVEIASIDGSVCDELSWEGVLVRSSPAGTEDWTSRAEAFELGPDGPAAGNAGQPFASDDLEKIRRDEREADRRRQQEEERLRAEQAATATTLAQWQAERDARRRAEEAASAQRAREETILREQQKAQLHVEQEAAAAALAKQRADDEDRRRAEEAAAAQRANDETIRDDQREQQRLHAERAAASAAQAKQPAGKDAEGLAEQAITQGGQEEAAGGRRQEEDWIRAEQAAMAAALAEQRAEEKKRRSILISAMLTAITIGGYAIYQAGYLCSRFDLFCGGPRIDSSRLATAQRDDSGLPSPSPDVNAHSHDAEVPPPISAAPNAEDPKRDSQAPTPTIYAEHIESYSLRICNHLPEAKALSVIAVLPSGDGTDLWWVKPRHTAIAATRCADFGGTSFTSAASYLSIAYVRAVIGEPSYTNPKNDKTVGPLLPSETATFCIGSSYMKGELPGEHCNEVFERPAEFWKVSLRNGRTTVDITSLTTVSVTYGWSGSGQKKNSRRLGN